MRSGGLDIASPYSSRARPVVRGAIGAVSAAHPLATAAAQGVMQAGGSAADAAIAAQAVLCVVAPDACGLGGDMLCLVRTADGECTALNGAGAAPSKARNWAVSGGASATVPGIVHAWGELSARWGLLPLARVLDPALSLARHGSPLAASLGQALDQQRGRLLAGGAGDWPLMAADGQGMLAQPALAATLEAIGRHGANWFYDDLGPAIASAVRRNNGAMSVQDLALHRTVVAKPLTTRWQGLTVHVQPPLSQGVLLSMCLGNLERLGSLSKADRDHAQIELTEACFGLRDRVGEGSALLDEILIPDMVKAGRRGGPRPYLHTAGVAAADRTGMVVTSLVSVFDDFGSCVYVPEGGFTLNNRGAGFTRAPNDFAPGRRPVHTLAPLLIEGDFGAIGMATPGADGQIQTLLQVLDNLFIEGLDIASAIDRPRWRSEDGRVLIEAGHERRRELLARGHDVTVLADGHTKFGAVVFAGHLEGMPAAAADWRRETWAGAV